MQSNCLGLFFIHLELELLTQFPAPNDEKYLYLCKKIRLEIVTIRLTKHLTQNILVEFIRSIICLKKQIYRSGWIRVNPVHSESQ